MTRLLGFAVGSFRFHLMQSGVYLCQEWVDVTGSKSFGVLSVGNFDAFFRLLRRLFHLQELSFILFYLIVK
jgi:hypothetical protein